MKKTNYLEKIKKVIQSKICVSCGLCVYRQDFKLAYIDNKNEPIPILNDQVIIDEDIWKACPGKGVDYPELYKKYYKKMPENYLYGIFDKIYIGFSNDSFIRKNSASGGIITEVLIWLLDNNYVDEVIIAKQGIPSPDKASFFFTNKKNEIIDCAQSVYTPVSMLDSLNYLEDGKRYAITCLPEQSAALRYMQTLNDKKALQIKYILGPYTGTSIMRESIYTLMKMNKIKKDDSIVKLKWRAGEWPGYLEIETKSGRIIRSNKFYYNFLIPFYITQTSLQSMDFTNEFTDISVGDAWSPRYEKLGQGFSVVLSRNKEATEILNSMVQSKKISLEEIDLNTALNMHGHMLDFKKRGSYIRNQIRKLLKFPYYDIGLRPTKITISRYIVEIIIITIFGICRTNSIRFIISLFNEKLIGYIFNKLRIFWKEVSKPTKRKGLNEIKFLEYIPYWKKNERTD